MCRLGLLALHPSLQAQLEQPHVGSQATLLPAVQPVWSAAAAMKRGMGTMSTLRAVLMTSGSSNFSSGITGTSTTGLATSLRGLGSLATGLGAGSAGSQAAGT